MAEQFLTATYSPNNWHIPPGQKENHLQNVPNGRGYVGVDILPRRGNELKSPILDPSNWNKIQTSFSATAIITNSALPHLPDHPVATHHSLILQRRLGGWLPRGTFKPASCTVAKNCRKDGLSTLEILEELRLRLGQRGNYQISGKSSANISTIHQILWLQKDGPHMTPHFKIIQDTLNKASYKTTSTKTHIPGPTSHVTTAQLFDLFPPPRSSRSLRSLSRQESHVSDWKKLKK